ncbi:MAG: amidohydrolase [Bacteroidales bacterium]|nr:amidohydrolase [Bacteroidales bacterium]
MIIINGKILTVDEQFTIAEALAIKEDKIIAVGSSHDISRLADSHSTIIDAAGRTVIPGIIDAHLHPEMASLSEIEETIPDVHSISELLDWIRSQSTTKQEGEWIIFPKMFFTRLIDLRQPTLSELDSVAPLHPVFLNGSFGGMINSAAMQVSGMNDKTVHKGILKDEKTGKLTGFIRASAFHMLQLPFQKTLSPREREEALLAMFKRYNRYGITSLCSGAGDFETFAMYRDLAAEDKLTLRVCQNILLDTIKAFNFVTGDGNEWARIGAAKVYLDGGILTGTAYLREPWGDKARSIFGIRDTTYRGVVNYSPEELLAIVTAANENGWKFTAHSTGGGGVDLLLDVYEKVNEMRSIKDKRFSIIHGNFFTDRAIQRMSELGVYADMQPAWFYKDADAMKSILGEKRIETFHPYRSLLDAGVVVNGGSDHMVKWDADASINPYNPFLAIWTVVTRTTERNTVIMPSEVITREEALRMYTINNAYASFEESIKGSLEPGKLADLAILSDDLLNCPVNQIKDIQSELTIVGGKIVYSSQQ